MGVLDRIGVLALVLVALAGLAGVEVFGPYAVRDWAALQPAWAEFERMARNPSDLRAVVIAEARQNAHRINLFAEGVWVLLSAILASIALRGLRRGGRPGEG